MASMYNKLFTKILDSSIWLAPDPHRLVWITLIAAMDEDSNALFACAENLASRARVSLAKTKEAIAAFESPDPLGPEQEFDGRRIERIPGGWHILNGQKYRAMITRVVAREQTRERVRAFRERKRAVTSGNVTVTPSESVSDSVSEAREEAAPAPVVGLQEPVWNRWIAYRKSIKKPLKPASIHAARKALAAYGFNQGEVVEQSIANGWTGLFPLKSVDKSAERKRAGDEAGWSRVRAHAEAIGCPLAPYPADSPDTYETRVKNWENRQPVKRDAAKIITQLTRGMK